MGKIELVFIPTPGVGHLISMVEFAKLIVQTNRDISILVIVYYLPPFEPTKLTAYIDSQSRQIDPNRITFVTLPPITNSPDPSSPTFHVNMVALQNPLIKQAIEDRHSKPVAFVLDFMNVSMFDVANEFHLPSYIYFPAGANFLYTMFHFQALADEHGVEHVTGLVDDPDSSLDLLPAFRNQVPVKVLPWFFLDKEGGWSTTFFTFARRLREVKGIFVNSFVELETITFEALRKLDNVPTIYPVGPVLSLKNENDSKSSHNDQDSIISWLDEQPKSSVVFLCFGSVGCFNADQVREIAEGLDRSGHRFLWSLRRPIQVGTLGAVPSENEIFEDGLPEGFLSRTAHRGKIIPWAPQVTVLAHQAIGGFVSHCGWNSIIESLWFGVPIATWPMYSEQQLNAFTLVRELGLAVEINIDYRWNFKKGNRLVTANEIEIGVRQLVSMDEEMKEKVREMSDTSRKALQIDGGPSFESLTRFIVEVGENVP